MNNKRLRKKLYKITFFIAFLCIVVLFGGGQIIKYLDNTYKDTLKDELKIKTDVYKLQIQKELENSMQTLLTFSTFFDLGQSIDITSLSEVLYNANQNNRFISMGYISKDGIGVQAVLNEGNSRDLDISKDAPDEIREAFNKSINGEYFVSDVLYSKYLDKEIILISVPVYYRGEIQGVLTASEDVIVFEEVLKLAIKSDEENNYIHMIKNNGDFIVRADRRIDEEEADSIYNMGVNLLDKNEVTNALESGKDYYELFELDRVQYAVYFSRLDYNDWYIFCINPIISKGLPIVKTLSITRFMFASVIILILFLLIIGYLIIIKNNKMLTKLAYFDELTGAYNSTHFRYICEEKLKKDKNYSIIVFNISKFKFINNIFGEEGADELLCYIKEILEKNILKNEYFCRDSADQFFVFIKSIDKNEILNRINKIKDEIALFSNIKNQNCDIKIYGGICNYIKTDDVSSSYKIMIDNSLFIMKEIKGSKEAFVFYDETIYQKIHMQCFIESYMQKALDNNEFKLFLQPKVNLETREVIGAESLVRWIRDDGSIIYPNDFIPLFEQNGFCEKLDLYMIERVCEKIKEWMEKGLNPISISVNQSKLSFYRADYLEILCSITNKYGIPNELITIEILEGLTIDNFDEFNFTIKNLHAKGFKVSMDDFGTGYSSFNTLSKLKIDELKIDKSFLLGIENNQKIEERQQIILKSIISLAKRLNIETVVEGLESQEHLEFISELGCDMAQGYYFSKPLSAKDFDEKYIN